MTTLMKENIQLGLTYSFRNLAHYYHVRKHGGTQLVMVLGEAWWYTGRHTSGEEAVSSTSGSAVGETDTGPGLGI